MEVERDFETTNSCFRNSTHRIVRCCETGRIGVSLVEILVRSPGDYSVRNMSNESCSSHFQGSGWPLSGLPGG